MLLDPPGRRGGVTFAESEEPAVTRGTGKQLPLFLHELSHIFRGTIKKKKAQSSSSSAARRRAAPRALTSGHFLLDWPLHCPAGTVKQHPSLPSSPLLPSSAENLALGRPSDVLPGKATLARLIPDDKQPPLLSSFVCAFTISCPDSKARLPLVRPYLLRLSVFLTPLMPLPNPFSPTFSTYLPACLPLFIPPPAYIYSSLQRPHRLNAASVSTRLQVLLLFWN